MKKFISLILSLLIVGGTLTLTASAADTSHYATVCYHIESGTCNGNNSVDKYSSLWKCEDCGKRYTDRNYKCVLCNTSVYHIYNPDCRSCGGSIYFVSESEQYNQYYSVSTHNYSNSYTCSSSYPCQNGHSAYRTVAHYYCTTHGWVGTDSKCPGLAVSPTPTTISLYYGQTQQITPNPTPVTAAVTYMSNNTDIATVSSTGLVKGLKKGNTTIVVTATL